MAKESLTIVNPFDKTGRLWAIFSGTAIAAGVILLLMTKSDFQDIGRAVGQAEPYGKFLIKLLSGLTLIGLGIKYARVSLSAIFKFAPDKKITENLVNDVDTKPQPFHTYKAASLLKILQSKDLGMEKPKTITENIVARMIKGLKNLPPLYFYVSRNFLNALISSASPLPVLLTFLFLHYLGIIDIISGNRFAWICLLISISVIISWSPFSPITTKDKKNFILIVLSLCSVGTFVISRTTSFDYSLPDIPASAFLVALLFLALSAAVFYAFYFLVSKRSNVQDTVDKVSLFKDNIDVNIHPDELYRVLRSRLADFGDPNLANRVYHDNFVTEENKLRMAVMQETQPIPLHGLKDSSLIFYANNLTKIGFTGSIAGLILFVALAVFSSTFVGILVSAVASFGLINFGLKLIHVANLFLSEFAFESTVLTVFCNGEYKSTQVTAGKAKTDSIESRNEVTTSSVSMEVISTRIISVGFMEIGKADPFEHAPRFIIALNEDQETINALLRTLEDYRLRKSQIVDMSGEKDRQNLRNLENTPNPGVKKQPKGVSTPDPSEMNNNFDALPINDN